MTQKKKRLEEYRSFFNFEDKEVVAIWKELATIKTELKEEDFFKICFSLKNVGISTKEKLEMTPLFIKGDTVICKSFKENEINEQVYVEYTDKTIQRSPHYSVIEDLLGKDVAFKDSHVYILLLNLLGWKCLFPFAVHYNKNIIDCDVLSYCEEDMNRINFPITKDFKI